MEDKEFMAEARKMQKELRVMEQRQNELIKKDKYGTLGKKEREELERLLKDSAQKAAENLQKLVGMSGFFKSD